MTKPALTPDYGRWSVTGVYLYELRLVIDAWHRNAFSWATPADCLTKLQEETIEAIAIADESDMLADELADCLICIVAASCRADINLEAAVARKLPLVMDKYQSPQPEPERISCDAREPELGL